MTENENLNDNPIESSPATLETASQNNNSNNISKASLYDKIFKIIHIA